MSFDWPRLRDRSVVLLAILALAAAGLWLLDHLFRIFVMVMVATVIAYALEPALKRAERHMPRAVAALGVFAAAVVVVAALVVLLTPLLLKEAAQLLAGLPTTINQGADQVQTQLAFKGIPVPFLGASTASAQIQRILAGGTGGLVQATLGTLSEVAGAAVDVVITAVMAFYFMVDGGRLKNAAIRLIPTRHRDKVSFVEATVDEIMGAYIRGQLILAATVGVAAGLGCWALGVHYPLLIGLLAFCFELVPMAGPLLASLPAIVIALFQPFPLVVWVVLFFLVLQMLENHVLVPRISGHAVGLHPLGALVALLIGAEAAGAAGALAAVPVAGILNVLARAAYHSWNGRPAPVPVRRRPQISLKRRKPAALA